MKIVVDIISGDNSPAILLNGVIDALNVYDDFDVIVIGDENSIKRQISDYKSLFDRIEICDCSEFIAMDEKPVKACKSKPASSVMIASNLVASGRADGFFSPGNTGATMTASLLNIKCIDNISRPAIAIVFPTVDGKCILLDCGANIDAKPEHFYELAVIGTFYGAFVFDRDDVRISLLNIGAENSKGNILYQKAFSFLEKSNLNFIGNIEANEIFSAKTDVILCDGFVGNVVLKLIEGIFPALKKLILSRSTEASFDFKNNFADIFNLFNPVSFGGAPLLGLKGYVVVGHGSSGADATKNAIINMRGMIKSGIQQSIQNKIISSCGL